MPPPKFSAPWSKSNRSHSSVGSSSDHSSSLPSGKPATRPPTTVYEAEHQAPAVNHDASTQRYPQPDDLQQQQQQSQPPPAQQGPQPLYRQVLPSRTTSHRHSSNLSLDRPPGSAEQQSPPSNTERPPEQRYSYQQPPPTTSAVPYVHEPKKSIRSRLGFGHSSKDDDPSRSNSKNSGGLGRRASTRRNDPPASDKYQSPQSDPQRLQGQHWQRQGSSPNLPTSEEEDESNLDPFLQQDAQHSPLVPPKNGGYKQHPPNTQEHYRPPLARVNTESSYHTQQGGVEHYSPEQHSGLQPQPPQYQPYQQPVEANQHPQQYQAFNPTSSPHPGNPQLQQQDLAQQNFYPQQPQQQLGPGQQGSGHYQQQQQVSSPSSLQQPPQDVQHLQHGQGQSPPQPPPLQQQEVHQPQAVHQLPQIVHQQDSQQGDNQHAQQLRPPSQQQFAPPSPLAPQYQGYDGQQLQGSDNSATAPAQPGSTMPPPAPPSNRNTLRKVEANQQNAPGAPSREGSVVQPPQQGQVQMQPPTPGLQSFGANVVPAGSQGQPYRGGSKPGQPGQPGPPGQESDMGRATPPPRGTIDMTDEELQQILKEHDILREKYQKVKRYFFEQQTQVHQLQNTLAHQRLSLSRTSWDDSEYSTRFNRLDGLIAQLSFAIRKDWKSIPPWLHVVVNKNAVETGKQEMTAVGRAFISSWLVDEIFERVFHPDLEPGLSTQLKMIQLNIRKFAPTSQSGEEEDALITKVINWRLATLEGLAETLRAPQCATNRQRLTDQLNEKLIATLQMHLQDPPPPDLAGGIPMIVELAINIAQHLPLESREVHIEYFHPGHSLVSEFMKMETGIPPLTNPIHDPNADADKASLKSTASDLRDSATSSVTEQETQAAQTQNQGQQGQGNNVNKDLGDNRAKRGMFGSLMGNPKKGPPQPAQLGKQQAPAGAGGSQVSLSQQPPGSSNGPKEEQAPPKVRLAVGFAVQIRGKSILIKAPVYST